MTEQIYQYGIVGIIAYLVIERSFTLLGNLTTKKTPVVDNNTIMAVAGKIAEEIGSAVRAVALSTDKITEMIGNQTFMLELLQERHKNHEESAKIRHSELSVAIKDHGNECRAQARRLSENAGVRDNS